MTAISEVSLSQMSSLDYHVEQVTGAENSLARQPVDQGSSSMVSSEFTFSASFEYTQTNRPYLPEGNHGDDLNSSIAQLIQLFMELVKLLSKEEQRGSESWSISIEMSKSSFQSQRKEAYSLFQQSKTEIEYVNQRVTSEETTTISFERSQSVVNTLLDPFNKDRSKLGGLFKKLARKIAFLENWMEKMEKLFELLDPNSAINQWLDSAGLPEDTKEKVLSAMMEKLLSECEGGSSSYSYQSMSYEKTSITTATGVVESMEMEMVSFQVESSSQSQGCCQKRNDAIALLAELLEEIFFADEKQEEEMIAFSYSASTSITQVTESKDESVELLLQTAA